MTSIVEWTLHVKFDRNELGNSYMIEVYLDEDYVGGVGALADGNPDHPGYSEGFVSLDEVLHKKVPPVRGEMPLNAVKDVIRRQLSIRVPANKPDGTPVDIRRDLPSLKIAPYSQVVTYDDPSGVPRLGPVTYYHELVAGKPGGVPADRWLTA